MNTSTAQPAARNPSIARPTDPDPAALRILQELESAPARLDEDPWSRLFENSLRHCDRGEWELGVLGLTQLFNGVKHSDLPGHFYSYLGYGAARCNGHVEQGLKLCNRAVRLEFYQPENYLNLARTYILAKDRRGACDAVARGLAIDPDHVELRQLEQDLGRRRQPVLGFLPRGHFLNRIIGRLRHDFSS